MGRLVTLSIPLIQIKYLTVHTINYIQLHFWTESAPPDPITNFLLLNSQLARTLDRNEKTMQRIQRLYKDLFS